jgi:transcriptional regulator with XRE-family HTH domain
MDAARALKRGRKEAGLTQRQLAERAGVPQSVIAKIESGRSTPRVDTFDRLLRAAGQRLEFHPAAEVDPQDWAQVLDNRALTPAQRLQKLTAYGRFHTRLRRAREKARRER